MVSSEVFNQDCVAGMKQYPDKHFDLAIVDPPYGIGDNWSKSRKDKFYRNGALYQYQNEAIPPAEYFSELKRVSKNQIIWGGNYFTEFLRPTNGWIIWDKDRNADVTFMSEAELAWTSFKKVMRIARFRWDGAKKCERDERIHPHQKPAKLYKWILEKYATSGSKILDTHLGSGSSRIAAYDTDLDFVGFEIDEGYFKAQEKRFEEHLKQESFKLHVKTLTPLPKEIAEQNLEFLM